jgi:hypothetical protein
MITKPLCLAAALIFSPLTTSVAYAQDSARIVTPDQLKFPCMQSGKAGV